MSVHKIAQGGQRLCAPCVDMNGRLYVSSLDTGDIFSVSDGHLAIHTSSGGAPSCLAFDSIDNALYVGDFAHSAVLTMVEDGSLTEYVKEYEGRPFIGPSALAFDFKGNLYIADSGPLGTSGIGRCTGALYMVSADDQILHPIIANGLAQPSGLAVHIHGDTPIIYVSEFSANRILKVVKTDAGSFHASVWVQLQGRSGVSSVTCDARGNVYAARFEFASLAKDGEVVVYSPLGVELRRIVVPGLPEITGLCFSENDGVLYVTEGSHNVVFKISM